MPSVLSFTKCVHFQSYVGQHHTPILFSVKLFLIFVINVNYFLTSCILSIVWIHYSFFVHLSFEEHLGCFKCLVIMSKATINMCKSCKSIVWTSAFQSVGKSLGMWSHQQWTRLPISKHPCQKWHCRVFYFCFVFDSLSF